jgi:hypothetical protein
MSYLYLPSVVLILYQLKLIANETDEISAQIKQLEDLVKNYYNKKTEN